MANSYFRFKQFTVRQERNAMKVCTDSCLFGAWIPLDENARHVLDIGTGTALLALMIAQRTDALVTAVELQREAALEAKANIENSAFANRIATHQGNILDTTLPVYKNLFDVVVCNPPFYPNHLQSNDVADVTARHDVELPLNKLLDAIAKLLTNDGSAFLLLPFEPFKNVESFVTSERSPLDNPSLNLVQVVAVKNFAGKLPIRWMIELKRNATKTIHDEIVIYNDDKSYTNRFVKLLQPYYLYL